MTTGTSIGTAFPKFPSVYGEKEAKRLKEVETQRATMSKIWQQKFSAEAWSKVSPFEKKVREIPFLNKAISLLPGTSSWDYGFNPIQAKEKLDAIDAEFLELSRRKKVNDVLPSVENFMIAKALEGKPVLSPGSLLPAGLDKDFNKEDMAYLQAFGQRLAAATKEDILSGKALGYIPDTTPEDYSDIYGSGKTIAPQYILSTIAFSKNVSEVSNALKEAYPPSVAEEPSPLAQQDYVAFAKKEEPTGSKFEELNKQYFANLKSQAEGMGIKLTGEESMADISELVKDRVTEEAKGTTIVISTQDGNMLAASLRPDNSIWYQGEFIGYYDAKSSTITSGEFEENIVKDMILDPLRLSTNDLIQKGLMWSVHSLPNQALANFKPVTSATDTKEVVDAWHTSEVKRIKDKYTKLFTEAGSSDRAFYSPSERRNDPKVRQIYNDYSKEMENVTKEYQQRTAYATPGKGFLNMNQNQIDAYNSFATQLRSKFNRVYTTATKEHEEWLVAHPELRPRAEWETPGIHSAWEIGYIISKNAPMTIASLATYAGVAAVTKNPALAWSAAFSIMYPSQAEDVTQTAIAAGASEEQAAAMGNSIGFIISALDSSGNIPIFKATNPALMKLWNKELTKELVEQTMKRLAEKELTVGGMIKAGAKVWAEEEVSETATEVLQQAIQNASAKVFNPEQKIGDNLVQVAYETAISVAPFAGFGGAMQISTDFKSMNEYKNMKAHLPVKVQVQINEDAAKLTALGQTPSQAELNAYNKVVETPIGQAQVKAATKAADKVVPVTRERRTAKLNVLNQRLATTVSALNEANASVKTQEANLAKPLSPEELSETREQLANASKIATQLELDRLDLIKSIDKINNASVGTITPEYIADRIIAKDILVPVEEQYRQNNKEAVEAVLKLRRSQQIQATAEAKLAELEQRVKDTEAKFQAGTATSNDVIIARALRDKLLAAAPEEVAPTAPVEAKEALPATQAVDIATAWDTMTKDEKLAKAIEVGVAKNTANKLWSELNETQQEKLAENPNELRIVPQSHRVVGDYEIMIDSKGRTIICG